MVGQQAQIVIIDADPDQGRLLSQLLTEAGHGVRLAGNGDEALTLVARLRPRLVISELHLPDMSGMDLFDRIHGAMPMLPVILLTAQGTIADAVAATRRGVFNFLSKPCDPKALLEQVDQALGSHEFRSEAQEASWRDEIITRSAAMEELLRRTELVATSDASVLILGESGTGKELLARAIHRASRRAGKPYVGINCAAVPEALLESELFGHVKGAFTGASTQHRGLLRAAEGGTVLLDEIGDMPLGLQVKLLRVIQERKIRPVGSTTDEPVDVRILSATHRNLEELVKERHFREDLYYRLNVVSLRVPTLGERREDIPLLTAYFLPQLAQRHHKPARALAPDAMTALLNAAWPGNVRQLYNVIEQAVALSTSQIVPSSLVEQVIQVGEGGLVPLDEAKRAFERDYLVRVMQMTEGNVSHAAQLSGRNRTELYKLLQRHDLSPGMFKAGGH